MYAAAITVPSSYLIVCSVGFEYSGYLLSVLFVYTVYFSSHSETTLYMCRWCRFWKKSNWRTSAGSTQGP